MVEYKHERITNLKILEVIMKKYEYVNVHFITIMGSETEGHRKIIDEYLI